MISPTLTVTPEARAKIDGVRSFNEFPEAVLRVRVLAKEGPRFRYEIALEDPQDRSDDDLALEADGLTVVVDPLSAADLTGASIDLDSAVMGGGLRIDNHVKDGTAFVRLGGGCQGCSAVDLTLRKGVETAIRNAVLQISAIVDVTDHEAGANPYYQHGH